MIDEPDAQASQERLTHVQIAQDASKPVSHDRLHEQAVAIYDLLDDNLFSVIDFKFFPATIKKMAEKYKK